MTATKSPSEGRGEHAAGTLGALLYADPAKTPLSEADWVVLVHSVAAGDQYALRRLYEQSQRIVFTLIVRLTNNRETAEEVTLDVFHEVWQRASKYDAADGTVVGWIMNIARSRAIDRVRFEQRKKRTGNQTDDPLPATAQPEPDEALDVRQLGRSLRDALTVLTADERQAIEVAYFSDLTYSQVAARLDEPVGTIKTRIRSGLTKLRQVLTGARTA